MRHLAVAVACASLAFALAGGMARAQTATSTAASGFETVPFSGPELLSGKRITEADCAALAGAVWVVVDRQGECIRYYHSAASAAGREAVVFLSGDVVSTNARGEARPSSTYVKMTPETMQNGSASWSRSLGIPYLHLGRPGTYGSSGEHAKRRTAREVELVSAALDAIKVRHGYARLHVIGYAEGGHTAAALLPRRTDLGCVVLTSALVSVRDWLNEIGRSEDVTGNKNPLDPIALVDRVAKRPDLHVFVLIDPDDVVISARSQTSYVRRATAAGLPVRQVFIAAPDAQAHALWRAGREIAVGCAKGMSEDAIVAKYQNKTPERPPDADEPRLHAPDVLTRGIALTEVQCKVLAVRFGCGSRGGLFACGTGCLRREERRTTRWSSSRATSARATRRTASSTPIRRRRHPLRCSAVPTCGRASMAALRLHRPSRHLRLLGGSPA